MNSAATTRQLCWTSFFTSAGVLAFELAVMRILLVASWHHFAFLVISIVLLGFGASGTALHLTRQWAERHGPHLLFALLLATAAAMPILSGVAQHVPIEARLTPVLFWRQIGAWLAFWMVLAVPLFLGAAALCLMLMQARSSVGAVYAANMIGSALGAIGMTAAMSGLPPEWLPLACGALVAIGLATLIPGSRLYLGLALGTVALAGLILLTDPPRIRYDPYKYGAYVERLAAQGAAERVTVRYGARGRLEAFAGEVLHDLPFLTGAGAPPTIDVLVMDGDRRGSVLHVRSVDEAGVLDGSLPAFAYELAPQQPRTLLLGETGGANVWLARRKASRQITVVQPDARIHELLAGPLRERGGAFLDAPEVRTVTAEPRHFIEHSGDTFDLIQMVSLESAAAGSAGFGGLSQDDMATVEGFAACLRRLSPSGVLTITRAIQTPPRDNLKILATVAAALEGLDAPQRHVIVVRDYLAVCTIVRPTPFAPAEIDDIRAACRRCNLTPVWWEGIRDDELNQPDAFPGPPGQAGDWYHHAARQLLTPQASTRFLYDWPFHIHPATDNSPFFLDFCKLRSIGELNRAFGDLWLTRAELGYVFVLAAIVVVAVVGAVLTLLPLLLQRREARVGGKSATLAYFAAIGLAYLLLEMTYLSRLNRWIGDPVTAASVTIAAFLLFSGLGSLHAHRWLEQAGGRPRRPPIALLMAFGVLGMIALPWLAPMIGGMALVWRCLAAVVVVAPLAVAMGFPMPLGLARLNQQGGRLIPWAWAINGFASVLAPPIATAIGMTWGFHVAGALGLLLYIPPAVLFHRLPAGPTVEPA